MKNVFFQFVTSMRALEIYELAETNLVSALKLCCHLISHCSLDDDSISSYKSTSFDL